MEIFGSNISLFGTRKREAPIGGVPATTDPNAKENQVSVKGGSFEENIAYVSDQERALRIATYYRCMELRANTMAQLTPQYQQLNREKGNYVEYDYGYWRTLNWLLQRQPNDMMSAFEFWRQVEVETVARGNAFILIQRDIFGNPESFWLATSGSYDKINNTYLLTYNGEGGEWSRDNVLAKDVIHIANTFRRRGSMVGMSTLDYASEMLTLSKTLDNSALETAAKGGRMKLFISENQNGTVSPIAAGRFDPKEAQKYADEINDRMYSRDVTALQNLDKIQNVSMSAADMQLFDQRQFGVAEICRVMAVPRTLAMDGSNSSYKTPEADRLDFLMNCIQPKRRLLEDELTRKLLTIKDFGKARIHLCELPLMMFDSKGRAEIAQKKIAAGISTVNEERKEWDMPAVENGDIVYISTNLMELGSEKGRAVGGGGRPSDGGEAAVTQQQTKQDGEDEE